jgi:hypothetical protein
MRHVALPALEANSLAKPALGVGKAAIEIDLRRIGRAALQANASERVLEVDQFGLEGPDAPGH